MSTNQELNMAQLVGADESTESSDTSTTKRAKYTLAGLKADETFEVPGAWIKRLFLDGEQASFWFWYKLLAVNPPKGMSHGELEESNLVKRPCRSRSPPAADPSSPRRFTPRTKRRAACAPSARCGR
jgi:hypothetical protein